ncbi:uncharacterized protein (TIGR00369 family) [Fontibacillus phaseoli]|uniref:Uncharacterized protein (TIGR00369 family) n=1 Tax=Fontibacillus phaseoli TaxID=1416533 RepID=A0A369B633_9BACL|nr:PaaI family thioesterase [Fontibacillus phaseoli]RCX16970.1 uncharacterized protein (TIGR00369 family) [Fontibacillus phaseoli]
METNSFKMHPKWEQWNEAAKGTFWDVLGCTIESVSDRQVVVSLEIQPLHLNLIGILHGGVHATIIDSAMGLLAMIAKPEASVVTTNLNLNYVTKASQGRLLVTAELVHLSHKSITAQAFARLEDGTLCAFGTGTFRVL